MDNARPGHLSVQTFLTNLSVPEKDGAGTQQTIVVQGLYHRYPLFPGCVVRRRGYERKGVVEMHNLWLFSTDKLLQPTIALFVPQGGFGQSENAHLLYLAVVRGMAQHLVTERFQQVTFRRENCVLATGLLIVIVYQQNR